MIGGLPEKPQDPKNTESLKDTKEGERNKSKRQTARSTFSPFLFFFGYIPLLSRSFRRRAAYVGNLFTSFASFGYPTRRHESPSQDAGIASIPTG